MNALIGTTLGDCYFIERKLSEGGFGAVFVAQHLRTRAKVAIKVLAEELAAGIEVRERFQDEVHFLGQLNHPHIVQIHDCGETAGGLPFMVMELLHGEDLESRLQRVLRLPLPSIIQLAEQVGSALLAAHQAGIVHRDIKPHNLFLLQCPAPYSTAVLCKVLDFGIAKFKRSVPLTAQNAILGTPAYMSPEAIRGDIEAIDGRSDQWSLAVVIYRLLTGSLPFDGQDLLSLLYQVVQEQPPALLELCPALPMHVAAAVMRALSKDKLARFPSIADFVAALKMGPVVRTPPPRPHGPWRRRTSLAALAVGLLVCGKAARSIYLGSTPESMHGQVSSAAQTMVRPVMVVPSAASTALCTEAGGPSLIPLPSVRSTPARVARARSAQPVAVKNPKFIPSNVQTSKEDINALFGSDDPDVVLERPERGR